MGLITFTHKGDFNNLEKFLNILLDQRYLNVIEKYANEGVRALADATPKESGKTAASWGYEIDHDWNSTTIAFTNSHVVDGVNIAIILQYGHGTRNGGHVVGRDYINPAIQPVFDKIADEVWKEVSNL